MLLLLVFCLKVRDQEFPYRRNLARVIVNVEDANDHSPYFTNPLYEASVFESAALGSAVLQVTALDKDKGENAELIYTIEAGESWCRSQHHAWRVTLRGIYHHVKFIYVPLECLQMNFWPSDCPICMMMVYKVLGTSVVCFPSLTARKEFPFTASVSDFFSGMEKREECVINSVDFTYGSTSHGLRLK